MTLPTHSTLTQPVFFPQPTAGYLRIAGDDQVTFLQRQSTNDLRLLSSERSILTVLTSPAARIVDVLRLIKDQDTIGAITLPGNAAETTRYLKSRIFFMDKVTIEDASAEFYQMDLDGPDAGRVLADLGIKPVPELDEVVSAQISGEMVRVIGQRGLAGSGYRLIAPAAIGGGLHSVLIELGAAELSPEQREVLRVEAGLPAAGAEWTGEYTPLETGLESAISDTKGCYTGQEVIARQLTYDKVTQRLVGLRLGGPVQAGDRVWAEDRPVGTVTSFAHSSTHGPIALAILKRSHNQPGARLSVGSQGAGTEAVVTNLPF